MATITLKGLAHSYLAQPRNLQMLATTLLLHLPCQQPLRL